MGEAYLIRDHAGIWSEPLTVPSPSYANGYFVIGLNGGVYDKGEKYSVFRKDLVSNFEIIKAPFFSQTFNPVLTDFHIDQAGKWHGIYKSLNYYPYPYLYQTLPTALSSTTSTIEQRVTIPLEFHAPTLSFMHRLNGLISGEADAFKVEILPDGGQAVVVFQNGAPSNDWSHAWADLSVFAGQTVTLRFTLTTVAGGQLLQALVDDVAIGSWTTPVIERIEPNLLPLPVIAGSSLTIHGANFMDGPDNLPLVKIGEQQVEVIWVDANTLLIANPETVFAGVHDVEVINPSGYSALLKDGLVIESRVYLPLMHK